MFEKCKVFKISCWGVTVTGVSKISNLRVHALLSYSGNLPVYCPHFFGIVQKVFSEKASAIARMRQKCIKNASKWVLFYWEKRNVPKCVRNASKLRQKCAEHLWGRTPLGENTFGGEHLLDDTELQGIINM